MANSTFRRATDAILRQEPAQPLYRDMVMFDVPISEVNQSFLLFAVSDHVFAILPPPLAYLPPILPGNRAFGKGSPPIATSLFPKPPY